MPQNVIYEEVVSIQKPESVVVVEKEKPKKTKISRKTK
jgi:hypothetical protein